MRRGLLNSQKLGRLGLPSLVLGDGSGLEDMTHTVWGAEHVDLEDGLHGAMGVVKSACDRRRSRRRRVSRRISAIAVTSCVLLVLTVQLAFAETGGYRQEHCCSNASEDGGYAIIKPTDMFPDQNGCVLQSITGTDFTTHVQLQVGLVLCGQNSPGIDGKCSTNSDKVGFVETSANGVYECHPHGTWGLNVSVPVELRWYAVSTWDAYFNGAKYDNQGGFTYQNPYVYAWAEQTVPSCLGWSIWGYFGYWQWWNCYTGFHTVTAGTQVNIGTCFNYGTFSNGSFRVSN